MGDLAAVLGDKLNSSKPSSSPLLLLLPSPENGLAGAAAAEESISVGFGELAETEGGDNVKVSQSNSKMPQNLWSSLALALTKPRRKRPSKVS